MNERERPPIPKAQQAQLIRAAIQRAQAQVHKTSRPDFVIVFEDYPKGEVLYRINIYWNAAALAMNDVFFCITGKATVPQSTVNARK